MDAEVDIIGIYRSGEREKAFDMLMTAYRERLYWHIRKMVCDHDDADDILQSTFVKVWTSLPDFRGDSGLFTWVYRIATNETLTFLKKKSFRAAISLSDYSSKLAEKVDDDPCFDGDRLQMILQKAVACLPPKQRSIFLFRYFEEMKYSEIAAITGTSEGALKASYHHAYEKVKKYISDRSDF